MSSRAHRLLVYSLLITLPFLLSGCFLRLLFGSVGQRDTDFGIVFIAQIGGVFGPMATCEITREGESADQLGECTYSFFDIEAEEPFISTSSTELLETFGVFGILIDPLILQVPADVSNYVATFSDSSITQTVIISETTSFNAQPGTVVTAEAGRKFLILEFPPEVIADLQAGTPMTGPFDFDLEFQVTTHESVDVKAMYTGRIEVNGQVYYPPLLPCVTSFADVPDLTIPKASTNFLLQPQIISALRRGEVVACAGTVYDFSSVNDFQLRLYMPSVTAHQNKRVGRH
jgi:hypothetical protein